MTHSPWRPRRTRDARAGLHFALAAPARPNPAVMLWRWRYEAALAAGLPGGLLAAIDIAGAIRALAAVAAVAIWCAWWPPARRYLIACAWRVITPHRIRAGCAEGWIYSSRGKLPVILRTSQEEFGERVLIWCRAGVSAQDFVLARDLLTAACWAGDIYVWCDPRHTHLVIE
jgi:hypothetical protein